MRFGILFRAGSCWIGVHWSRRHRRVCVNPLPCVTLWVAFQGGRVPMKAEM